MSWAAVVGTVVAAGSSYVKGKAAKKAAKQAENVPQIDPEELNRIVTAASGENARNSLALESELNPLGQQFRNDSLRNALAMTNSGNPGEQQALQAVLKELAGLGTTGSISPLFQQATDAASADLARGGNLPIDVQNQVTRQGLANASRIGGGSLGLGQFVVPRDLGLSSLALRNQAIDRAGSLGATATNLNNNRVGLRAQLAGQATNIGGEANRRAMAAAALGQSIQSPQVGLDPGSFADIYSQNKTNAYNGALNATALRSQANQNYLTAIGQLYGGAQQAGVFGKG